MVAGMSSMMALAAMEHAARLKPGILGRHALMATVTGVSPDDDYDDPGNQAFAWALAINQCHNTDISAPKLAKMILPVFQNLSLKEAE